MEFENNEPEEKEVMTPFDYEEWNKTRKEMNDLNTELSEKLFGVKILGEAPYDDHGEGAFIRIGGYYNGPVILDYFGDEQECMCKGQKDLERYNEEDYFFGHHKFCLAVLPDYSGDDNLYHVYEALTNKGYIVNIMIDKSVDGPVNLVTITSHKTNISCDVEEKSLPLAVVKAALKMFAMEKDLENVK